MTGSSAILPANQLPFSAGFCYYANGLNGAAQMVDLSPQRHDEGPIPGTPSSLHGVLNPDGAEGRTLHSTRHFFHERAETFVQRLSRWAGPAALILTLCLIGWWIIR